MKIKIINGSRLATCFFSLLCSSHLFAQRQEVGLTLGRLLEQDRTSTTGIPFRLSSGTALQADYEHALFKAGPVSIFAGVHFLANPQRTVTSTNAGLTRDVASLYITPGLMVKIFPQRRFIPWGTIGGGFGDYEQSQTTLGGAPNPASRHLVRGVFTYGGGVDIPIWRFIALRGEVRDFYTGNAAFNVPLSNSQHNVVAGGGIVLRFGGK